MDRRKIRDFASVLDELLADSGLRPAGNDARPSMRLDYLAVADELHSGKIVISQEQAAAAYDAGNGDGSPPVIDAPPLAPEPDGLDTDPEAVRRELGLDKAPGIAELDALRRRFAAANHPDRVADHLRGDAMVRMQIANMLIDEAKRKKRSGGLFRR